MSDSSVGSVSDVLLAGWGLVLLSNKLLLDAINALGHGLQGSSRLVVLVDVGGGRLSSGVCMGGSTVSMIADAARAIERAQTRRALLLISAHRGSG